jgi:hypothetical protein
MITSKQLIAKISALMPPNRPKDADDWLDGLSMLSYSSYACHITHMYHIQRHMLFTHVV